MYTGASGPWASSSPQTSTGSLERELRRFPPGNYNLGRVQQMLYDRSRLSTTLDELVRSIQNISPNPDPWIDQSATVVFQIPAFRSNDRDRAITCLLYTSPSPRD